jgi:hypothetical protein
MSLLLLLTGTGAPPAVAAGVVTSRPPLGLHAEVTDANGARTRWDAGSPDASMRPQNLSFRTARMTGFADASVTLNRRVDTDYIDLHLLDNISLIGDDGSTAYEGRVTAIPKSMQQSHQVTVQAAGWIAHTRDRKFTDIIVDRDLSAWGDSPLANRVNVLANPAVFGSSSIAPDAADGPAIVQTMQGAWTSVAGGFRCQNWYDAGPGNTLNRVYWTFQIAGSTSTGGNWTRTVIAYENDDATGTTTSSGEQSASGNVSGVLTITTPVQYARIEHGYFVSGGGAGEAYETHWTNLAAYGTTVPVRGTEPGGVYASDVIQYIAQTYCPQLDTSGVQDTTYVIPHLVFKEPTEPYEAMLRCNAFHLWDLGVWEDRVLHYAPVDMSTYDWQVRLSDHGVQVDLQGDSVEQLANGISVTFQDLATGAQNRITPDTDTELADTDPENPANKHGLTVWTDVTLTSPTTEDAAAQMGRALLNEFTSPRAPGTITVQGHLRDQAGNWQQAWKVRAGDTIIISDHPNDRPRLITETTYNADNHTVTITVEGQPRRLDAVIDRLSTALTANTLG